MRSIGALPAQLLILLSSFQVPFVTAADLGIETTKHASCSRHSQAGDQIAVHYIGTLQSTGAEFDQSYKRGSPLVFTLGAGQVIAGWDQGLLDMCPGEERKLTIPPELGYGEFGHPPVIPGGSTLIFETKLVEIVGVEQEEQGDSAGATTSASASASAMPTAPLYAYGSSRVPSTMISISSRPGYSVSRSSASGFTIATAPATPPSDDADKINNPSTPTAATSGAKPTSNGGPKTAQLDSEKAECHLLGPFALLVQGALGVVALLSLVYKRKRETPKRPWKIFLFDVSKQVVGSMLTHVLNLAMSMLGAVDMVNTVAVAAEKSTSGGRMPNPCSFYLLNLAIDTTIGIPILYLLLKILHGLFVYTPLARPVQSIKSGNYGSPPRTTWWLKQALIYFIGLTGMKLFVWLLFALLPWLPWVGDWALRWTNGNTALQITFAMFIFPLAMNALQYWIIDSFIMDRSRGGDEGPGYERVQDDEDDDDDDLDETDFEIPIEEEVHGKGAEGPVISAAPPLSEVSPMPVPDNNQVARSGTAAGNAKKQR